MSLSKAGTVIVGSATVIGTLVAILTYCKPPESFTASKPALAPKPILPRADTLPMDKEWMNASGPSTFELKSSVAVFEPATGAHGPQLAVRFLLTNKSKVPVNVWARSEFQSNQRELDGWVIDAGETLCKPNPTNFSVIPVGTKDLNLLAYNDNGNVVERAPLLNSGSSLYFTVRFECEDELQSSAFLFATSRISLSYKSARRDVYFQTSGLNVRRSR